jgi:hypothetical protein
MTTTNEKIKAELTKMQLSQECLAEAIAWLDGNPGAFEPLADIENVNMSDWAEPPLEVTTAMVRLQDRGEL